MGPRPEPEVWTRTGWGLCLSLGHGKVEPESQGKGVARV